MNASSSAETRQTILARSLAEQLRRGWRVETQSGDMAVIVKGRRPNHILHLLLTLILFPLGFGLALAGLYFLALPLMAWPLVWITLAVLGFEKRALVTVDADSASIEYERAFQRPAR